MLKVKYTYKYPISAPVDRLALQVQRDEKIPDTIAMYQTVQKTLTAKKYIDTEKNMWVVEAEVTEEFDAFSAVLRDVPRDGLVLELLLFEGSGTVLHDTSRVSPPNNGTIYGAVWQQLATGKWVMSMDGVDDYVDLPFILNPATTDWTALVLFKTNILPSSKGSDMVILQQRDGTGVGRSWIYLSRIDNSINSYLGGSRRPSGVTVEEGKWYFAVLIWVNSDNTLHWYINAEPKNSHTFTIEPADGRYLIGVNKYINGLWFDGLIGLVRIYNRALDPSEIKEIYELESPLFGITP